MFAFIENVLVYLIYLIGFMFYTIVINVNSVWFERFVYTKLPLKLEYEYIIVGTGTAGSIIASGIPSRSVLVLEAGNMRSSVQDIPIFQPLIQNSRYDWKYETEAQNNACLGLNGNKSKWPMGKIFGGTHMLNNLIHFDGNENDFNDWFKTSENLDMFLNYFRNGNDKYIHQEKFEMQSKLGKAILEAGQQAGYSDDEFYQPTLTSKNGQRWTASHYYEAHKRSGNELVLNALVRKLIIEQDIVKGLMYEKNGEIRKVYARKGVILSAGVIGSPKILMHSGIGPAKHLNEAKINLNKELPVGLNLQDHLTTGLDLILLNQSLDLSIFNLINPKNVYNYFYGNEKKSSLTLGGCEAIGFVDRLQFMIIPAGATSDKGVMFAKNFNLKKDVWVKYFKPLIENQIQTATILPVLLNPQSQGYVKLKNADPHTPPIIQPNYLSTNEDVKTLVKGIKIIKQLIEMPAMQKLGAEINPMPFPGCAALKFDSDDYWECYVRHLSMTVYHPIGTCRMGNETDEHSVVSNKDFRVHGFRNLFVVDGSIIPKAPSGNPNSIIAALAHYFLKIRFNV